MKKIFKGLILVAVCLFVLLPATLLTLGQIKTPRLGLGDENGKIVLNEQEKKSRTWMTNNETETYREIRDAYNEAIDEKSIVEKIVSTVYDPFEQEKILQETFGEEAEIVNSR